MKGFLIALAGIVTVIAMTGCNTVEGFGQDVQKGGQKIEEAAER